MAGFLYAVSVLLLNGCSAWEKQQQAGAAVELNGHYLYRSTLDSLTLGLSSEDSLRVTQQYISQWAKDLLLYDAAKRRTSNEIEALVESYRRTLYVHAYEEYLVDKFMSKTISDSTAEAIYTKMPELFRLDESIMKGVLVVVPNDAAKVEKLRKWLAEVNPRNEKTGSKALDNVEKYAYQNASGYELFADKWLTTTEMLSHIPIERTELETRLKSTNQIEVSDTLKTYVLQVTDKRLRGEQMPRDYARPQIEKIVLSGRQVEFLQKERERMYNEAIQSGKIVFFDK